MCICRYYSCVWTSTPLPQSLVESKQRLKLSSYSYSYSSSYMKYVSAIIARSWKVKVQSCFLLCNRDVNLHSKTSICCSFPPVTSPNATKQYNNIKHKTKLYKQLYNYIIIHDTSHPIKTQRRTKSKAQRGPSASLVSHINVVNTVFNKT